MYTLRIFIWQALTVFCTCPVWAQLNQPNFERLNLEQGLSQGTVYCMLQDQKGFLWVGTQDGLNKYDGYSFTVFRYDRQDTMSISDNWINCLFEDNEGYLWIGTLSGGLNRFDRAAASFTNYRFLEQRPGSLASDNITTILQDHRGNLWVGTDQGLSRKDGDIFVNYEVLVGQEASTLVHQLFEDSQNRLWVGTDKGLFFYNQDKDQLQAAGDDSFTFPPYDVRDMVEIEPGILLVGTQSGLYQLQTNPGSWVSKAVSFSEIRDNKVNALEVDTNHGIWIGYDNEGTIQWDPQSDSHISLKYKPDQMRSLSNDLVYDILQGKFGNIWIGTLNGISRYNMSNIKFRLFQNIPGITGHTGNSIFSITKDESGHLWTATRDGIYRRNLQTGIITRFNSKSKPSLQDDSFRTVFLDHNNKIWIGSVSGFIDILDPKTMETVSYSLKDSNAPNPIYCIFETDQGAIWLGAKNGLYAFDRQKHAFQHYPLDEIRSIKEDSQGFFWIGTLGAGVYRFTPGTATFQHFRHDPNDRKSLSHDIVASIYIDPLDTLWIGTASGFNKYHKDEGIFYNFSIGDGLPAEVVYGILPGDEKHLWLSTNNGLTKFDRQKQTFRTYHISDGLQGSEFNAGGYYRSQAGELFFGGLDGVNAFFPEEIKDQPLLPEVILTGFKVLNENRVLEKSLEYITSIDLSYKDYFFSFEFTALHLAAPERNRYAYKLEGFDRDWIYTDRRFANYTNLDPGNYTFKVKASNNDGVWNEAGLAVDIFIAPPFWRTLWFYMLSLLTLGAMIYLIYRLRVGQIRKEEKLKTEFNRKLSEVEMSALRSQMNPHFLFNSLNSINRYIVKSDPETASGYLTKFSRLIRLILQNSKSAAIPLSDELEALKLYIEMEDLRFENKFDYNIQLDPDIEADYLEVPPMMIQPYVENAIWHGLMHKESKGYLMVSIHKDRGSLKCIIEDNGIGREKARDLKTKSATTRKSMGMKITSDRLSLINDKYQKETAVKVEDLKDPLGYAKGTRVTLTIPIEVESWDTKTTVK